MHAQAKKSYKMPLSENKVGANGHQHDLYAKKQACLPISPKNKLNTPAKPHTADTAPPKLKCTHNQISLMPMKALFKDIKYKSHHYH